MQLINPSYFRIYLALVRRDLLVIKQRLGGAFVDAVAQLMINLLTFGAFLPIMGLSTLLIIPIFIGSQIQNLLFVGTGFGLRTAFDVRFSRFIDSRLILPVPKRWIFASYVTYFVLEAFLISAPILAIGLLLLSMQFASDPLSPHWFLFFPIYIMTLTLFGLFFLGFALYYSLEWFRENLWARRLTFVALLSPLLVTLYLVRQFSTQFARIMLLSPLTYAAEGFRSTLLIGDHYLSPYLCLLMLAFWLALGVWFVSVGVSKRLDPV